MTVKKAWKGAQLIAQLEQVGFQCAVEIAGEILNAALPLVPRDTEQLAQSGKVAADYNEGVVVVSFGDNELRHGNKVPSNRYATVQHEDMTLKHPKGGQAKYLEQPFREIGGRYTEEIAKAYKDILK